MQKPSVVITEGFFGFRRRPLELNALKITSGQFIG